MTRIESVLVGRALPFGPNGEPSAIDKRACLAPVQVGLLGLAGDEQGDRVHHGGPDKALHHYAHDHYVAWRSELPAAAPRFGYAGAFGENLSTCGLTEQEVCVGDVYRLGTARVQVSQARQPCWRLNLRFGVPDMARRVQTSGRTGWYYRVLEPGTVEAGATLSLEQRSHPEWPLARLLHFLYVERLDFAALERIAELSVLATGWRRLAARRLESRAVEDWSSRVETPRGPGVATRGPDRDQSL
jgi:MOSC domain-containing protein YiiM